MRDFKIFRLHAKLVMVHLIEEGRADKIHAFDSFDEAYSFILNNEELIEFWEQYLAKLN
tara:strand:- start:61 stop:237 length:177 start_codon:yes stop_codon:yes gene_type:complete